MPDRHGQPWLGNKQDPVTVEQCQEFIQEVAAWVDGSDTLILDDGNTETFEVCFTKDEADQIVRVMNTMASAWDGLAGSLDRTEKKINEEKRHD